ncbi:MAG: plasmid stabilization protein [Armatimonadetes bacterium CG2_30_59_28]|nr:type II toxin-antitoxin system RelE/ParE family toxin [Armatimonadota bacterium]OIO91900.1 MAG: plasmid stabilization protein [Armatimonadetes bacterium CG2_30_59_28]PIU65491.1 MAG: plasmid stabilization protein [Armatimonadetes bacterium CG07_land_8_20_14_0_80_59_28]PIX44971.1 MAG: plasmid stabilization protein [Armatimonadetes bacterium CG_4_8_14_3_um_filter_58_9]PJB63701.1 MAG: plasmid stabilization protein [Armatimonadetes bacterium CG_4_9_14_3_um_filter_58_7]
MKSSFRRSFERDVRKVPADPVRTRIKEMIEAIEAAGSLTEVPNVERIHGTEGCYRIRVGDYRLGIYLQDPEVEFVRCLHRREIYRHFP